MVHDRDRLNYELAASYFADVVALIRAVECVYLSELPIAEQGHLIIALLRVAKPIAIEALADIEKFDHLSFTHIIGERA